MFKRKQIYDKENVFAGVNMLTQFRFHSITQQGMNVLVPVMGRLLNVYLRVKAVLLQLGNDLDKFSVAGLQIHKSTALPHLLYVASGLG